MSRSLASLVMALMGMRTLVVYGAIPARLGLRLQMSATANRFTLLECDEQMHIIGARKQRRTAVPSEDSLLRQLEAERVRHRELSRVLLKLDTPITSAWNAPEIQALKRRKLWSKDRLTHLLDTLRRLSNASGWQLGSGAFGRILLGKQSQTGKLVAVKVVPSSAEGADVVEFGSEADILARLTDCNLTSHFPRLLHCGSQVVLGQRSTVLVMDLLGPRCVRTSSVCTASANCLAVAARMSHVACAVSVACAVPRAPPLALSSARSYASVHAFSTPQRRGLVVGHHERHQFLRLVHAAAGPADARVPAAAARCWLHAQ